MHYLLRSFYTIFRENCVLYVIIYTLFSFYTWVWFFFVFCRFWAILPEIWPLDERSMTPHRYPQVMMVVERRKNRRMSNIARHGWSMVVPTIRGVLGFPEAVCFFKIVRLSGSFSSIISHNSWTSRWFHYKKTVCNIISTSILFPPYSIPSS